MPKAKILSMPRTEEHRNGASLSDPARPPSFVQPPPDAEEEALSAAKIAKWLRLADTVLISDQTRKKA